MDNITKRGPFRGWSKSKTVPFVRRCAQVVGFEENTNHPQVNKMVLGMVLRRGYEYMSREHKPAGSDAVVTQKIEAFNFPWSDVSDDHVPCQARFEY